MDEVTRILSATERGDPHAAEQSRPLMYDELRKLVAQKLAQEKLGQALQAMALVHEVYLRFVEVEQVQRWNSRGHFFAGAAAAMRRILIDRAREKQGCELGGKRRRGDFRKGEAIITAPPDDVVALDEQAFSTYSVTEVARAPIEVVW
jgi:RNA polymerase sigma factor (TIGR02999 family)